MTWLHGNFTRRSASELAPAGLVCNHYQMRNRIAIWLVCSVACTSLLRAQDLQGAGRVIETAREPGEDAPLTRKSFAALRGKFIKDLENLSPEDAAKGWLSLVDTWMQLSSYSGIDPFPALPPVEKWDALATEIDTRTTGKPDEKSGALWLLASVLRDDEAESRRRVATLRKTWAENDDALRYLSAFEEARWPPDAGTKLEQFRKNLKEANRSIRVPDLTGLPRQEAEELIFEALDKAAETTFEHEATREIAVEAVMRDPKRLKGIVWSLVGGPADGPLIEVMLPPDYVVARNDYTSQRVMAHYFSYLVDTRAFDKADKVRKQFPESEKFYLTFNNDGKGLGNEWRKNFRDYFLRVLRGEPSEPFWSDLGRNVTPDDSEVWDFFRTSLD